MKILIPKYLTIYNLTHLYNNKLKKNKYVIKNEYPVPKKFNYILYVVCTYFYYF